jgi:hypothetical protein
VEVTGHVREINQPLEPKRFTLPVGQAQEVSWLVVVPQAATALHYEVEAKSGDLSEIEIIIFEGKFHQIKRMFEVVGKKVKYLKRIQMGNLSLDESLKTGDCRELSSVEISLLKAFEISECDIASNNIKETDNEANRIVERGTFVPVEAARSCC